MRKSSVKRDTLETKIEVELNLDGTGQVEVDTGIGFFDHMLTLLGKHGLLDLKVKAVGDLAVDTHHTVEDVGIVLGMALKQALGDKTGINRYGSCHLPMDEALVVTALDISSRPYLVCDLKFTGEYIGDFPTEMIEEFWRAVAVQAGFTLHFHQMSGRNNHHIAEAAFKSFAHALRKAAEKDPRITGVLSSKGKL